MSYLTQLQTNNTNLQACIDKANALPEAGSGGGGSVETCTVTINSEEEDNIIDIMYLSNTGIEETYMDGVNTLSVEAKKDSIIVVYGENINDYNSITTNGIEFKLANAGDESIMYIFYATGDGTIGIA